jgi:GLPGLI family protein
MDNKMTVLIKTALYWAVLILTVQVFSQSGTISYSNEATMMNYFKNLKENDSLKFEKVQHFAEYEKGMMSRINYRLNFSNEKSVFKPIVRGAEERMLLKTKQCEGIYYKDFESNYFYINKRFKDYNVQLAPIEWEITSDSKQILGYTCYKAYGFKNYEGTNKSFSRIEAWFTNEIELSHGPKGINGLPGLILEAHKGSYHFYAEDLKIESQESISKPTTGEIINEFNFNKLMQSSVKQ